MYARRRAAWSSAGRLPRCRCMTVWPRVRSVGRNIAYSLGAGTRFRYGWPGTSSSCLAWGGGCPRRGAEPSHAAALALACDSAQGVLAALRSAGFAGGCSSLKARRSASSFVARDAVPCAAPLSPGDSRQGQSAGALGGRATPAGSPSPYPQLRSAQASGGGPGSGLAEFGSARRLAHPCAAQVVAADDG